MVIPQAQVHETEFASAVEEVERALAPEVVRLRYSFGDDWTGEPSVFFRVLFSDDAASRLDKLGELVNEISFTVDMQLEPLEKWGVLAYYRFRSQAEQAQMKDPAWA